MVIKMRETSAQNGSFLNWFRRYIWLPSKLIFTPVALLCIAYIVWLSRLDIVRLWAASNGTLLVIACILLGVANFFSPLASRKILQSLGVNIEYRVLLRIHMLRLPARYLPGGIWHTIGRAVDLHEHGVNRAVIGWMVVLENGLAICMAFLLGWGLLQLSGSKPHSYEGVTSLVAASAFVVLITLPALMRKFGRDIMQNLSVAKWMACCVWFAVIWAFHASAFVAYSIALVGNSTLSEALHTGGVYLFSWGIGLVAFFAPQGIGVFEVTAAAFAEQRLLPAAIAMVAGFRLCMLTVDLCLGLGGRLFVRR